MIRRKILLFCILAVVILLYFIGFLMEKSGIVAKLSTSPPAEYYQFFKPKYLKDVTAFGSWRVKNKNEIGMFYYKKSTTIYIYKIGSIPFSITGIDTVLHISSKVLGHIGGGDYAIILPAPRCCSYRVAIHDIPLRGLFADVEADTVTKTIYESKYFYSAQFRTIAMRYDTKGDYDFVIRADDNRCTMGYFDAIFTVVLINNTAYFVLITPNSSLKLSNAENIKDIVI